jgi:hypothetical protein
LGCELSDEVAIDGHRTGCDESLAGTAGPQTGCGQKTIQPHWWAGLFLRFGFWEAHDALAVFEETSFAEKFDALKTFQNTTAGLNGARAFQTGMLAHKSKMVG